MKSRDWKDIAELIGITAIVASLLFVGLQMKQSQDIASAERIMLRAATFVEVNNALNEYAGIWVRGNSGEELDEDETVIFRNLVVSHQVFYQSAFRAARQLGIYGAERSNLVTYASFLYKNPGARRAWNLHEADFQRAARQLYPPGLPGGWADDIRSSLAKLDKVEHDR